MNLAVLVHLNPNPRVIKVALGVNKGCQRTRASIQALTGNRVDSVTCIIHPSCTLAYEDFIPFKLLEMGLVRENMDLQSIVPSQRYLSGDVACQFF